MASYQPELHTSEEVLSYYDGYDTASYSVYVGHKVEPKNGRYTYSGDDKNEGREQLTMALSALLSNPENTNTYCIAMLEKKGKKIEDVNSISFQLNKRQSLQPYSPQQVGNMGYPNPQLLGEINSLKSQISALQMKLDQDDEEEEEDPEENGIMGFLKDPEIRSTLLGVLQNFISPQIKVKNMAGVMDGAANDQDEKIDEAIETLKQFDPKLGDDLILLAQLALNDPAQFNFLLKMLRK
jgi:hypothetical protein